MVSRNIWLLACAALCAAPLSACNNTPAPTPDMATARDLTTPSLINALPSFVSSVVPVAATQYDGVKDDLLTAGVGQAGLLLAAPAPADPSNPTAAELRRNTLVNQYKALQDLRPAAGFGTIFGPDVAGTFFHPGTNDGQIPGKEYVVYDDDGSGDKNVVLMVQIPTAFDPTHPCIVAVPSSGSRNQYGGISTAGEWGLKAGCAVAYSDRGGGANVHDLSNGTAGRIDGTRGAAATLGKAANFIAQGTATTSLSQYTAQNPARIAVKHAHSGQNPEASWATNVLDSIRFALYVLNLPENYGKTQGSDNIITIAKKDTIVIAASVSNGGGSVLRAAEQDSDGLIDGVVASEPNVNPSPAPAGQSFTIQQGAATTVSAHGRALLDYITYINLFQPCASAGTTLAFGWDPSKGTPPAGLSTFPAGSPGRCSALHAQNLLTSTTLAAQIAEAQGLLNAYGLLPGENSIAHPYEAAAVYQSIATLYANAYGRFRVTDNLCGYSYATVDANGEPVAQSPAQLFTDYAAGSGIPPTTSILLLNNMGNNGAGQSYRLASDFYLAGALCLRSLFTGTTGITSTTGTALTGTPLVQSKSVQVGIAAILATGNLRGKPAIIVHGRDDALLAPNHTSRSYYGLNQRVEGQKSQFAYVEVLHANHLDVLNSAYAIDTQISLQIYFNKALDKMYAHLRNGAALPKSQVMPNTTLAKSGAAAPVASNFPDFDSATTCPITFSANILSIPDCTP